VLLLDTVPRLGPDHRVREERDLDAEERSYLEQRLLDRHGVTKEWLAGASLEQQLDRFAAALQEAGDVSGDVTHDQLRRFLRVTVINTRAARAYRPPPYSGRVALLRSTHTRHASLTYGWDALAAHLIVEEFDTGHDAFISRDHAPTIARHILELLQGDCHDATR
jgi:thioesterase domain-containing protein